VASNIPIIGKNYIRNDMAFSYARFSNKNFHAFITNLAKSFNKKVAKFLTY